MKNYIEIKRCLLFIFLVLGLFVFQSCYAKQDKTLSLKKTNDWTIKYKGNILKELPSKVHLLNDGIELNGKHSMNLRAYIKQKKRVDNLLFEYKDRTMSNGDALVLDMTCDLLTSKFEKRFEINLFSGASNVKFHMIESDYTIEIGGVNYLIELQKDGEYVDCQLALRRYSDTTYQWRFSSGKQSFWGEFKVSETRDASKFGFTIPVSFQKKLRINSIKISESGKDFGTGLKAVVIPREQEKPKISLRYDSKKIAGTECLKLNGLHGKVTKEELKGLNDYLIKRPLLSTNYHNTLFASWTKSHMMTWVYDQYGDIELVNRLIEQAKSISKHRNDRVGVYRNHLGNGKYGFTKGWNHFRGVTYENGKTAKKKIGIATLGTGINYSSAAAFTIAKHPELWSKSYNGETYKDIALAMLEEVHDSWQFAIEHYYDKKTNLLISPSYGAEPAGYVPQWNRIFPLMCAGNILVDASELLGINDERVAIIDSVLKSLFNTFWDFSRVESVNGKDVIYFPYGVYRWREKRTDTEDGGHFGFDLRGFRVFHESGRYWDKEKSSLLANVLNQVVIKDNNGTFTRRLSGEGVMKNYSYWGSIPPMIWLAEFEPELEYKLVEYAHNIMSKQSTLDGRVVFHTLHLRAKKYGFE